MNPLDATRARRRFLLLRGLRWLPTGLLIPVLVLLMIDRGFSLGQIGLVTAAQGVMIFLLELPTGGFADALGRRPVLLLAGAANFVAVALLTVADSMAMLAIVFALQGVYRALESGPLDAWYVDAAQRADPDADIERGLSQGGVVVGAAVGFGCLLSGGLVALGPVAGIDALVVPLLACLVLEAVHMTAVATLMTETRQARGRGRLSRSLRETPQVIGQAVRLIRSSRVLMALVFVEILWGFGMATWENLMPARLAAVAGDPDRAGVLLGPVNAGGWLVAAAGAALVPMLTRRVGAAYAGAIMRVAHGLIVAGIGLAAGPIGVIVAYLLAMGIHGAANPVHLGLLHRAVDGPTHRATVVSANSLTAQSGGALGGICLGVLADATSITTAVLAGAIVLAAAAPLYLLTRAPRTAERAGAQA